MVVLLYNKIGLNILINKLPVLSGVTPYSIYCDSLGISVFITYFHTILQFFIHKKDIEWSQ